MRAYFEPLLQQLVNAIGTPPSSQLSIPQSCLQQSSCCSKNTTPSSTSSPTILLSVKSLSLHIFQTGSSSSQSSVLKISSSPQPTLPDGDTGLDMPMMTRTNPTTSKGVENDYTRGGEGENLSDFDDDVTYHQNQHPASKRRESDIELLDLADGHNDDGTPLLSSGKESAVWYLPPPPCSSHHERLPSTTKNHHHHHTTKDDDETSSILDSDAAISQDIKTTYHHRGRPDLSTLTQLVLEEGSGGGGANFGAVYACGPSGVMSTAKDLAIRTGLLYNYEVFE